MTAAKSLILIDLDDTLWDTWENNKESLNELYTALAWGQYFLSFEDFFERYYSPVNHALWEQYNREEIDKDTLSEQRLRRPLECRWAELAAAEGNIPEGAIRSEERGYWTEANARFIDLIKQKTRLCPGALELVAYLQPRYTTCVLSNGFGELQYAKLAESGLAPYIDHVVLSEEVGYNKPNPRIFDYALALTGRTATEALMLGDSWASDIIGASNAGVDSIWYNRYLLPVPESKGVTMPQAVIHDLGEAIRIL